MNSLQQLIKVVDLNKNTNKHHEWFVKTVQERICYRVHICISQEWVVLVEGKENDMISYLYERAGSWDYMDDDIVDNHLNLLIWP